MERKVSAIAFAILAASLYAINIPFSKLLLLHIPPTMLAGLLYLGAGIGMGIVFLSAPSRRAMLGRNDLPYTVGMVVLDVIAPILLMFGVSMTSSANVSLLNNFEIVATALVALAVFRERISPSLWRSIGLVTIASAILSFEGTEAFGFDLGSLFVLLASVCWGFENNCTRMLSSKSSEEIVLIKGLFSGTASLLIAFLVGERPGNLVYVLPALLLGFVSYGLSIDFYILAQSRLGAARTSAWYSINPFLGVAFSMIFLGERPGLQFYVALAIMALAAVSMAREALGSE